MLFDPLEEQFDSPAQAIELSNSKRGQGEIVGQKDQSFLSLGIFELDSAQRRIETLTRVKDGEHAGLIADQARGFVHFVGVAPFYFEIGLGACDEEAARFAQSAQALEVDVATIHYVERSRLGNQLVEQVDFVPLAIADINEGRDIALKSSSVCNLIAALVERNGAHGNTDRHRSMVVASSA